MRHLISVLAALCCGAAWGAAPNYSAAGILKNGEWSPGPFAPNSIVTVFGTGLARSAQGISQADIKDHQLPVELNYTRVYLDGIAVPLFYVSETQVNFLVPSKQSTGDSTLWVMREGLRGPAVTIQIVDAAPALFSQADGFAIASHTDYSLISSDAPARAGETVVLWTTGLGKTVANPQTGEIPAFISPILHLKDLKVMVNGNAVEPANVLYAGLSPGWAGLYQINFTLPEGAGKDPEIRIFVGAQGTPAGLKLAVR